MKHQTKDVGCVMSKYRIKLNKDRCIGCQACEVHCKVKNKVPVGIQLNRIIISGPKTDKNGKLTYSAKYQPCLHCKKPECVPACPTGAMTVREADGLVYVQYDLCDGCKSCAEACPWNVPQFNEETGKIMKCDYCMDRIDQGVDPACVTGCTAHALTFVRS